MPKDNPSEVKDLATPHKSVAPKRCRPHTQDEWDQIKPIVRELYIDQDLTLREVSQRLQDEHGFYAK